MGRQKQPDEKPGYRKYSQKSLSRAMDLITKEKMTTYRAAKLCGVPQQTLRDRVRGKVSPSRSTSGPLPILSVQQERSLVQHIKDCASLGFTYSRKELVTLASELINRDGGGGGTKSLGVKWYYSFLRRWPELRAGGRGALPMSRVGTGNPPGSVERYFRELEAVILDHGFQDRPEAIYNIDETILKQGAKRGGTTVTIVCAGNGVGTAIPPYFVFPGASLDTGVLVGMTPGCAGTVSKSGCSNSEVFMKYLNNHFGRFRQGSREQTALILLDGHESHVSDPVRQWARVNNAIPFILPPRTNPLLQPLHLGCLRPFREFYREGSERFVRENPDHEVTTSDIARLACRAYVRGLTTENIISSFREAGIIPFNRQDTGSAVLTPENVVISNVTVGSDGVEVLTDRSPLKDPAYYFLQSKIPTQRQEQRLNVEEEESRKGRKEIIVGNLLAKEDMNNFIM